MTLTLNLPEKFSRTLAKFGDLGRGNLFAVASEALHQLVTNHLRRIAPTRHATASRLGASPTQHIYKGIEGSAPSHTANSASVTIPLPGISRAFHDVTITPKNAKALTLPVHAMAYGHRVSELRSLGWNIFRNKGETVLMGKQEKSKDAPVPLYALKKRVQQRQDRSLLPTDEQLVGVVKTSIRNEVARIMAA